MSLYTLNREDFRDFETCPKIVALKAYRELSAPPKQRKPVAQHPIPALIGKAGEAAFELAFSDEPEQLGRPLDPETERRRIEREILQRMASYRRWIDSAVRDVIADTVRGILLVRRSFRSAYGTLNIMGRGESRNGVAPCYAEYDYVALRPNRKPVIVEVKNTSGSLRPEARFQAAFYNSLSEHYGVVIRNDGVESGRLVLRPVQVRDSGVETLLVNPRDASFEVITDKTDISPDRVRSIWEAKQLGFRGRTPQTNCGDKCSHLRYSTSIKKNLPEDTLEPVHPLPLAYATGMIEAGADLQATYLKRLFRGPPYSEIWGEFRHNWLLSSGRPKNQAEITRITAEQLGISPRELRRIFFTRFTEVGRVEGFVEDETKAWERLVGRKRMLSARKGGYGAALRVYPIPSEPKRFVRDCDRAWS